MTAEFVSISADDGLVLDGFWISPDRPQVAIVHIHGKGGNFYHNSFLRQIYARLPDLGIAILGLNTRGNGALVEAEQREGRAYVGSMTERLDDSILDIRAGFIFAQEKVPLVFLQGHSYGCDKVVFAVNAGLDAPVVLISPTDSISLFDNYNPSWADVSSTREPEDGTVLRITNDIGIKTAHREYPVPMDAVTLRHSIRGPDYRTFDLRSVPTGPIENPALILIGGDDDLQLGRQGAMATRCREMFPRAEIEIRAGADHWFHGLEPWLADRTAAWVSGLAARLGYGKP